MHVSAVGGLPTRRHETSAGKIAQSGRVGEDLDAWLAVPDHGIAAHRAHHVADEDHVAAGGSRNWQRGPGEFARWPSSVASGASSTCPGRWSV
jgi:hypothetical protein